MANFCKVCGSRLEEGAQFCPSCGAKLEPEAPKSYCVVCGAELEEGARFCKKCGASAASVPVMPQKRYCISCGAELVDGARFCKICGASADSAAPAPPVRPAAPAAQRPAAAQAQAAGAAYAHQDVQRTYASDRAQQAQPIRASQRGKEKPEKRKKGGFVTFLLLLICAGLIYLGVTRGLPNIRAAMAKVGDPGIFQVPDQENEPATEPESAFVEPAELGSNEAHPTLYFGGVSPDGEEAGH